MSLEIFILAHPPRRFYALLLLSCIEGLPLELVEAQLYRRSSIVMDVAGDAKVGTNNVMGFVAASPNSSFLGEAMERERRRCAEWKRSDAAVKRQVRGLVPVEPTGVFVDELMQVIDTRKNGSC